MEASAGLALILLDNREGAHGQLPWRAVATLRTHLQHLIAVRDRLRSVAPGVAATPDAGWPSAVLGALAPDRREPTGETRVETHGYDHLDPESMRRAVSEWLARHPAAAALLRTPGAPAAHVAFVLGTLLHVSLDALVMLGRLNLLPERQGLLVLTGVDLLPFAPADRVSLEEVAAAPLPEGFPHAEIRMVGEMVRELGTCDPKEILDLRLEMPLCRLVPRQREITLRGVPSLAT